MTTTAPDRRPSTPGQALRQLLDALPAVRPTGVARSAWMAVRAAAADAEKALDAAPAVYSMPAEPPETVTTLWDRNGDCWLRRTPHPAYGEWVPDDDVDSSGEDWPTLLVEYGPLSTVAPERTETSDA